MPTTFCSHDAVTTDSIICTVVSAAYSPITRSPWVDGRAVQVPSGRSHPETRVSGIRTPPLPSIW
jgi:hypothetical protein